jgi:hypothetical protein
MPWLAGGRRIRRSEILEEFQFTAPTSGNESISRAW